MAKFYGLIGFDSELVETSPSVFEKTIVTRSYYGDILQEDRTMRDEQKINDDITVGNRISIVADAYALNHMFNMVWVEWMGVKWKAKKVDVKAPRLIISLGDVYND